MFDMQRFADTLQKYRKERGFTQNELAHRLMVTPQAVSKWERGEVMPDVFHLYDLATVLSVSVDTLLNYHLSKHVCYIGVDGGGTKTEFLLIDGRGRKLKSVVLEGCNPSNCGLEQSIEILRRGISYLRAEEMHVAGIFIGAAGMGGEKTKQGILSALGKTYPHIQIDCDNDIHNVIACCSNPNNCIAAISGTGCIVYSSTQDGLSRIGGHGYLLDHNGSGFDVGRDAVIAAMEAYEETGPATLLMDMVQKRLGGTFVGHGLNKKGPSHMASFAPLVFQAAEQGDEVAQQIIQRNADHMSHLICAAYKKAPQVKTVILSGSLFSQNDRFFNTVVEKLPPELKIERLTWPPVWGACMRCIQMCGLEPLPDIEKFLSQTL